MMNFEDYAKITKNVEHPIHYNQSDRKECIVEIEEKYGENALAYFCLCNSYKYLYRAGLKEGNSSEQDIAKARWYFNYINNIGWFNDIDFYIPENMRNLYFDIKAGLKND